LESIGFPRSVCEHITYTTTGNLPMPKERFHLYLADEFLKNHGSSLLPAAVSSRLPFLVGALSPDIFYYDFPLFSLSPLGDALHDLMSEERLSIVGDWMESRPVYAGTPDERRQPSFGSASAWTLGLTCHFLLDAVWHPAINRLSVSTDYCLEKRLSSLECHRLIESELEALRLTGSHRQEKYAGVLKDLRGRERLFEIASLYRELLAFASLGPVPPETRIVNCFLSQNFFLTLFANATLGRMRNRMLNLPFMRYLGSLVIPALPVLPVLFADGMPPERNPFSDLFMERAFTLLKLQLPVLAKRLL
jgi:hypothetical protein